MKRNLKGFILGFVLISLILFNIPIFASGITKTIKVVFNSMVVKIDGKVLTGDKISYNGKTYVDIKSVSDLLGKDCVFDAKNQVVNLNNRIVKIPTVTSSGFLNKGFYSVYFSDGFAINITDSKEVFPNSNYEYVMLNFNTTNYKDKTLLGTPNIIGSNEQENQKYNPVKFLDYKKCILVSMQENFRKMDFYENYSNLKSMETMAGIIVFDNTSKITNIEYNDGIHKCKLFLKKQDINTTNTIDLSSTEELQQYLKTNYSELNTLKGKTNFTFLVVENKSIIQEYDYWIQVVYDPVFFYNIQYSNQWTDDERIKVKQELKDFMEKLGRDLVNKLPSKKLYGGYIYTWYKYPNLKLDLQMRLCDSWKNYDDVDFLVTDKYNATKPTTFRWWDSIDNIL